MYNPELEGLIDAALADGMLTEKEKQILFKKAQAMGVDLDEFEMVLDARLVKLKKAEQEKAASSAPKSNKLGDVKKCPACGAMVQSYQGVCPECGYAFEGMDANSAVKELSSLLQKTSEQDKMEKLIDTYPIPMEKAALLAFITWLRPQSTDTNNPLSNTYYKKYAECVNKIRVSFANDSELQQFIGYFESDTKYIKKQKLIKLTLKSKLFWIGIAVLTVLILILKPAPMNKNPERTTAAIIKAVEEGDLNRAEQLYVNYIKDKRNISKGRKVLCRAYINKGQLDKAEEYMCTEFKNEMFDLYLKNKEYDKADRFFTFGRDIRIIKIIKTMCENGEKDRARKYLAEKKAIMKKDFERHLYGDPYDWDGKKKYNERVRQIEEIIASY